MLRVTEEKERNFEKRGYMGKKVLGVLTILLILTGCQNMGNESENLQQVEKQENGEERNSSISNDETLHCKYHLLLYWSHLPEDLRSFSDWKMQ